MKHEWRKKEKLVYIPKAVPTIINLPPMLYVTIEGQGNPNSESFAGDIGSLYAISYGIRMSSKGENPIKDYFEYTVYPLEGSWGLNQKGIDLYTSGKPVIELKDYLTYKLMIRQANFVTETVFKTFKELAHKKTKNARILDLKLETIEEGLSCQMLHLGSYDDEPTSFTLMEEYCKENGYKRVSKMHKEVYLTDARKTAPEKQKTTIRFQIQKEVL